MAKHWYKIDILEGDKGRVLVGASEHAPPQLVKQLQSDEYLLLTDLTYRDNQNRMVSWSVWDPRLASVAYINPKYITSVMPFVGDPRSGGPAAQ